jgi:hypothetical protein
LFPEIKLLLRNWFGRIWLPFINYVFIRRLFSCFAFSISSGIWQNLRSSYFRRHLITCDTLTMHFRLSENKMFIFWACWFSNSCRGFGDSRLKKRLLPNFTPKQGRFSVKSGGSKKQKARKHCVSRAFKHN